MKQNNKFVKKALSYSKQVSKVNNQNINSNSPDVASNATNYKNPLSYEVNTRTGDLQIIIAPPLLSGFFGGAVTPAIRYLGRSGTLGESILGLPLGWGYNFSFILKSQVFINGKESYYIDSSYASGMRYYKLKNVTFKSFAGKKFPYNPKLKYVNMLIFQNGDNQYFDKYGRLIGIDDRFGNHVLFHYNKNGNVYDSKLTKIIDAYGQEITFDYLSGEIRITYPKGGINQVEFAYLIDKKQYLAGYRNPIGQNVIITNKGGLVKDNLISSINYPNGLQTYYDYTAIRYYADPNKGGVSRLDAVASVREVYNDSIRTTLYNYDPLGNAHNFTGYPKFSIGSTEDTLLQSNDNDYRY
ncbi:MAG: hypothetical protein ACYC2U_03795, partial [Candidatus Amoebophilus sp.]